MTMHLTDEELHDYAGGELDPRRMDEAAAHLDGCADCRARAEPLIALTARLAALPRAADSAADGWDALHARLRAEAASAAPVAGTKVVALDAHRRRPALTGWMPRAAAAAVLLGVGFGGGRLSRAARPADAVLMAADTVATAMQAAALVQRAGTEYVAAVAQFVAASRGGDTLVAAQGREATIAACYGASRELTRLRGDDSSAVRLYRTAALTREAPAPAGDTLPRIGVMF
jgi:anti-sigma factor RsiW